MQTNIPASSRPSLQENINIPAFLDFIDLGCNTSTIKEQFIKWNITLKQLPRLNHDNLQNELGVSSKLQRIKILRCVQKLLNGEYEQFLPFQESFDRNSFEKSTIKPENNHAYSEMQMTNDNYYEVQAQNEIKKEIHPELAQTSQEQYYRIHITVSSSSNAGQQIIINTPESMMEEFFIGQREQNAIQIQSSEASPLHSKFFYHADLNCIIIEDLHSQFGTNLQINSETQLQLNQVIIMGTTQLQVVNISQNYQTCLKVLCLQYQADTKYGIFQYFSNEQLPL